MSYREMEARLQHLRMCGCSTCQRQYEELRHRYERERRHSDYYDAMKYVTIPFTTKKEIAPMIEAPKIEEPKNMAIKLLVDKLKVEQNNLRSTQSYIDNFKKSLKEHNANKAATNKNIKELSDALKKLGHKENK